jgi:site-specific recombinase XerD
MAGIGLKRGRFFIGLSKVVNLTNPGDVNLIYEEAEMKNSQMQIGNLIQGFRLSCQAEGKSPKTTEWYNAFLGRFLHFLASRHFPTSINAIDRDHIREFIHYLQSEARTPRGNKPLSGATIQSYVRTVKVFFSWAQREDYIKTNTVATIPVPKATTKLINAFSTEQVAGLLTACQVNSGTGCRNLAMLLIMLDCGIRVSELVSLDLEDVDIEDGYLRIRHGKGEKERLVPVGSVVRKVLWKYTHCSRSKPLAETVTRLFLSEKGLPLTKSGVQQILKRCARRAGITGVRCSPHTIRHTFAKNYLMNGGDIFSLQKILGALQPGFGASLP